MIKKGFVFLFLSIFLVSSIWASGSSEKEGNVTITMQHSMVPPEANDLLKQFAAQYKEETGVTVEISYVPWENQRATTLAKIASGNTPDRRPEEFSPDGS